jgi:50S ribosomal protein L16 3-hydroxylase
MNVQHPLTLLGGLTPAEFMQRHWQRKPLLVRQAISNLSPLLGRSELFDLAAQDGVESRLVQGEDGGRRAWQMQRGPFKRRAIPKLSERDWTLLVQGVDLHNDGVADLMQQFRFVPDARIDDVMISYASDGGGVGPHFDSYDVFLLQVQGQRRWRIGRQKDLSLRPNMPLKVLADFKPEQEFVLNPGDMLYLPPRYAHDGVALGPCMTYSVGFRAPDFAQLGREILVRMGESLDEHLASHVYRDPDQLAVTRPGAIPQALQGFAQKAVQRALNESLAINRTLGELMTEPKANVWFEPQDVPRKLRKLRLNRRSRMMYDKHHIFLNGESWRATGADGVLMRELADKRQLGAENLALASVEALALLADWCRDGWLEHVN